MWPYYAVILGAVALAGASDRLGDRWRWRGWTPADAALVALLSVFCGVRWKVGTDFELYSAMYRRLDQHRWLDAVRHAPQEPGFTLLRLAVKSVAGEPPMWLFLTVATLTVLPAVAALKLAVPGRLALAVATWACLGPYLAGFNGVRQALATSLLLLGTVLLPRRRFLAAVLLVLAISCHVSSLVVLGLLLATWRWRPRWPVAVGAVAGATALVVVVLPLLGPLLGALNPRYAGYVAAGGRAGLGTLGQVVVLSLVLAAVARWSPTWREPETWRWWLWGVLAVAALAVGFRAVELGRLTLAFKPFLALLLPAAVAAMPADRRRVATLALGAFLVAFLTASLLVYDDLLPYRVWPRIA